MTKTLQVELPDEIYDAMARLAGGSRQSPEQMVAEWITAAANTIEGIPQPASRRKRRQTRTAAGDNAESKVEEATYHSQETLAGFTYELRVMLIDSEPPIWRRLQVPGRTTLIKLHRAMQMLMGWQDYHLHQFRVNGLVYGMRVADWQEANPAMLDERGVKLYQIAPNVGSRLLYQYDFGDGWELELVVESIKPRQQGRDYPVCIDGQRAGPPEDVGGIGGYAEFVKAIGNPGHPEHRSWLEWVGGSFDPEKFDREAVNQALKRIR